MSQKENRTGGVRLNPDFFSSGLIEVVPGYKKLTIYLSRHIRHAGSSKKSAVYKQTLINTYINNVNYRWVILSIIFFSQFVLSIAGYGWGPLAPFFKKLFSLNSTQIGTISSTFYFTAALSAFPAGIIVDRYGVKKGLLSWLALTGFPLFFLSFFHKKFSIFLIMVGIAGLGYGLGNPVASKGLFIWFEKKIRGTVFGIRQSAVTVGSAIAGILLIYISQKSGPFVALRTVSLLIAIMMVLSYFFYKTPKGGEDTINKGMQKGKKSIISGFTDLFSNKALLTISLVAAMLGMGQGIVSTFFLLYIYEKLGYSLLTAGSLYTIVMISGAIGRIFWGVISDWLFNGYRKPVLIIICFLTLISVTTLAFWVSTWSKLLFLPVVVGLGISCWGWNGITFLMVTEISDSTETATFVGLATTFGWLGLSLGPMVFGNITDHFGYFYAWMSLAFFCNLSFLFCFLIPIPGPNPFKVKWGNF